MLRMMFEFSQYDSDVTVRDFKIFVVKSPQGDVSGDCLIYER